MFFVSLVPCKRSLTLSRWFSGYYERGGCNPGLVVTTDESGAIILKVAQPWVIIPPFDSRGVGGKTNL